MSLSYNIKFYYRDINFKIRESKKTKIWLSEVIKRLGIQSIEVEFYFVSKNDIIGINKEFLNHNYETDIISFTYDEGDKLHAEYFLCPEVIKENSVEYSQSFQREIRRVMVHGILHSAGFKDQSEEEFKNMKLLEENFLVLYG